MLLHKFLKVCVSSVIGIMLSACQQLPFIGGDEGAQIPQNKPNIVQSEAVPTKFELTMHAQMPITSFSQQFAYGFNKVEGKIVVSNKNHNMTTLLSNVSNLSHLCVSSASEGDYLVVTDGSRLMSQYWVQLTPEGIKAKLLRTIKTRQETNHCAISNNKLYNIDTDFGLWQRNLSPQGDTKAMILISSNMFQALNSEVFIGGIHNDTAKLLLQRQSGELVVVNLDNLEISELDEQPLLVNGKITTSHDTQLVAFSSGHNLLTKNRSQKGRTESVTLKFKWQQDTVLDF